MQKIHLSDQEDRELLMGTFSSDLILEVDSNDKNRIEKILEIHHKGKLRTATDYHRAALIMQHGNSIDDLKYAILFMEKAIKKDSTINKSLLAMAINRKLKHEGKPQLYGTQIVKDCRTCKWRLYDLDSTSIITDSIRKEYGVKTISDQLEVVNELNKGRN